MQQVVTASKINNSTTRHRGKQANTQNTVLPKNYLFLFICTEAPFHAMRHSMINFKLQHCCITKKKHRRCKRFFVLGFNSKQFKRNTEFYFPRSGWWILLTAATRQLPPVNGTFISKFKGTGNYLFFWSKRCI